MPELLARAPYQGEGNFSLSIRRSTAIGIAVSLAVHLFALFFIVPKLIKPDQELSEPPAPGPITARIQLPSRAAPPSEPAPAQPAITPTPPSAEPPREAPRRRPTPQRPTTPPIITRRGPAAPSLPAPPVPERPLPTPFPQPPADSLSLIHI